MTDGRVANKSAYNVVRLLKACAAQKDLIKGYKLHAYIEEYKFLEKNAYIASTLVSMYAKCGALVKAEQVLKELSVCDVTSWNALIAGYVQQGQGEEALKYYDSMRHEGLSPDAFTFSCALKACGSLGATARGEEIHQTIVSLGMLEKNVVLGNTLLNMYVKCHTLVKAQKVLEELCVRDVITWNSLIAGYAKQGQGEEALKCYDSMQHDGHLPDVVTFICALKACGSIRAAAKGERIHEKIVSLGMLEKEIRLGNTLVDMYAKCAKPTKAQQVLEQLPVRDVVTWNALIAGYAEQGQGEEALKCYDNMQEEGHSPDEVTFNAALKACGCIGAINKGEQIYKKIISLGILEKDFVLGSTLVDMYVKCGALAKARKVLEELPVQDVVSWSTLISGYGRQGQGKEAMKCLDWMQFKGVKPNMTTLTCVLNACSHSALLDQAEKFFFTMGTKYGITPDEEHYCCMVDLFSRVGKFNNALAVLERTPFPEYVPMWLALLGACRTWQEVEIGILAFEHVLNLDKCNAAIYMCMADLFSLAGMQEEIR